ncbi:MULTISPECIES: PIG-L deacetylase family protein [unclassified Streptomyces]|uniref:PIG-L deacetylase family protein n=1 Tax=unclassified Streptomyces TaxID=2593676 RepID=UPI002E0D4328|nr:PIG-L family deacetylase [Streptomyces sp. NBC_01207]WTA17667.1 PIG-L family deacetylase [Streptomyces sp. NBC_00853]
MRRVLAISPHLDDAVLSAGGRLFELASEGVEVTVFTVFAGRPMPPFSPVAAYLHGLWGLGDAPVVHRQAEDRRAVSLLGAAERHGSFLDAVYRRTTDGEAWLIGMDGVPPEGEHEPELAARLADAITDLVGELRPDTVLTCAAIGGHLDHRRTRDAVLAAATPGVPILCWEDLPYGHRTTEVPALPEGVRFTGSVAETAADPAWEAKYRAIEAYDSQLTMLWPNEPEFRPVFDSHATAHAREHGLTGRAELFWNVGFDRL